MDLPRLALSVRQPWAWAIIHAGKDIENRSWQAVNHGLRVRGRIAIHAAKGLARREYERASEFMASIGVTCPPAADLLRGGIVGSRPGHPRPMRGGGASFTAPTAAPSVPPAMAPAAAPVPQAPQSEPTAQPAPAPRPAPIVPLLTVPEHPATRNPTATRATMLFMIFSLMPGDRPARCSPPATASAARSQTATRSQQPSPRSGMHRGHRSF